METIRLNFKDKILKNEKIVLLKDGKVITTEKHLVKIFKGNSENIAENVQINQLSKIEIDNKTILNKYNVTMDSRY